jgi:IS30 family transposase
MTPDMITVIESKLRVEWSPEQISGWLLNDQALLLSHESVYLHVWADKRAGGDLSIFGIRGRSTTSVVTENQRAAK